MDGRLAAQRVRRPRLAAVVVEVGEPCPGLEAAEEVT